MRLSIFIAETVYGIYKNDMALELFSSFRKDGVLQDFYAAIIMYNLASIIAHDCKKPPKGKKINMSVAVGVIHILCPVFTGLLSSRITHFRIRTDMEYLSHCLTEVRPGRFFERVRRKRKTSGKFYRHLNFSLSVRRAYLNRIAMLYHHRFLHTRRNSPAPLYA